jgi:hypothetical protein
LVFLLLLGFPAAAGVLAAVGSLLLLVSLLLLMSLMPMFSQLLFISLLLLTSPPAVGIHLVVKGLRLEPSLELNSVGQLYQLII